MAEELVVREDAGGIATLTLNDPGRLNALSVAMLAALEGRLDDLARDRSVRVVVLRGAGRAFCAGHDLREMAAARTEGDAGRAFYKALFDRCSRVMTALPRLPQPVIAQAHGVAVAAGCQLVAACDMAVAAEGTRFGVNGVNIGLFCSTPMVALTRAVPRKAAFEMLTTGRLIEAEEARALGLVNRIAPAEGLAAATRDLAETVAAKLGAAVAIGKGAFYDQAELGLEAAYALAGEAMVTNMLDADTAEGVCAFVEKRKPAWAD